MSSSLPRPAIETTFLAPTNTRAARVKATCYRGSITLPWNNQLDAAQMHRAAAHALCAKIIALDAKENDIKPDDSAWAGIFTTGTLEKSYVHVFGPQKSAEGS